MSKLCSETEEAQIRVWTEPQICGGSYAFLIKVDQGESSYIQLKNLF